MRQYDVRRSGPSVPQRSLVVGGAYAVARSRENMIPVVRDLDLRLALSALIEDKYRGQEHVLVPEVDISVTLPGRIDAILVADRICGFEIKSDVDSLRRLPRQVQIYGPALERATLVVGDRYAQSVVDILPSWWAIWTVRQNRGGLRLVTRRRGRLNPDVQPYVVASFIPRDTLVSFLREQGFGRLSTLSVDDLRWLLVESNSKNAVLTLARSTMMSRRDWRCRAMSSVPQQCFDQRVPASGGLAGVPSWALTVAR